MFYTDQLRTPPFPIGLVKTESDSGLSMNILCAGDKEVFSQIVWAIYCLF